MPCGLWISSSISAWRRRVHAERVRGRGGPACLSSRRSTTRSPCPDGIVETRTSTARPAMRSEMRPSCGRRFSAMSSLRHDLDARHDQRRDRALGLQHFAQHAVDAEAHHQAVLERLDVDVGGVLLDRLRQQRIDQADDRRVVVALEQVGRLGQLLGECGEVGVVLEPAHRLHRRAGAALVGLAQQRVESLGVHALELQRHAAGAGAPRRRASGERAVAYDASRDAVRDARAPARRGASRTRTAAGAAGRRRDRRGQDRSSVAACSRRRVRRRWPSVAAGARAWSAVAGARRAGAVASGVGAGVSARRAGVPAAQRSPAERVAGPAVERRQRRLVLAGISGTLLPSIMLLVAHVVVLGVGLDRRVARRRAGSSGG